MFAQDLGSSLHLVYLILSHVYTLARIRFVLSLHHVLHIYYVRFAHSLSKDSNGSNSSVDTLPRDAHVSQGIVRVDSGPGRP